MKLAHNTMKYSNICWNPTGEPIANGPAMYATDARPFGKMPRYAIDSDAGIVSLVRGLFVRAGPAAVVLTVPSIIVNAIYRKAFWLFAHIGKKCLKAVPLFTYSNATPSVVLKVGALCIGAALHHIEPSYISATLFAAASVAVCLTGLRYHCSIVAPAGCCYSAPKSVGSCGDGSAAIAGASPSGFAARSVLRSGKNCELGKTDACQINESRHFITLKLKHLEKLWQVVVSYFSIRRSSHSEILPLREATTKPVSEK